MFESDIFGFFLKWMLGRLLTCFRSGFLPVYYFVAEEDMGFQGCVSPIRCSALAVSTYWWVKTKSNDGAEHLIYNSPICRLFLWVCK